MPQRKLPDKEIRRKREAADLQVVRSIILHDYRVIHRARSEGRTVLIPMTAKNRMEVILPV